MPAAAGEFLPNYRFINSELETIAANLADIAVNTDLKITFEEARQWLRSIQILYLERAKFRRWRYSDMALIIQKLHAASVKIAPEKLLNSLAFWKDSSRMT